MKYNVDFILVELFKLNCFCSFVLLMKYIFCIINFINKIIIKYLRSLRINRRFGRYIFLKK